MDSENLNLYFREIIYQDPKKRKDSVCGIFYYEAINQIIEDMQLGNLYIVAKISNIPKKEYKNSDFLLNLLSSAIKREFYSNHQRTTLEALESALQSANIYLADFVKKGHSEWIGNLHLACLAFSNNDIHVCQTGNMIIRLFRNETMSNVSKKFDTAEELEPIKTFSNIASGKIEPGDKILIATYDLSEIVSAQKTKELLLNSTTDKLYHFIKNNLKKNALACLIFEAETQAPQEESEKEKIVETSIEIKIDLREIFNSKVKKLNEIIENQITLPNPITAFFIKHNILKYVLILFLGLIIILSPYLVLKINYDIKIRQINNLIQRTQENINRSELSLIYQNQSESRSFLKQANALLENINLLYIKLPEDAKQKVSKNLKTTQELFDEQKNSLNNVINISEPVKLADLSKNTYSFRPNGILKLQNLLYLYELTSGFLYKIDLINNSSELVFLSSKDTFKLGSATDNEILLLANPEKIAVYNFNKNYNLYLLKPNLENTLNIKDMFDYNDSLFFLDVQRLNIFKYSKTEDILNGSEWIIKGPTDELTDAVSLAVDGDVYVARENGTIIQYSQGKKLKELKLDITPPLTNVEQIFTQENLKNLYILDSQNNRIISFDKKDGLIKQYSVSELSNLKDFWVDSDEKTIYLLNASEIYKIEI